MFRRLMAFLASSSLSLFLFLTVTLASVVLVFTPANVKMWLKDSGVYNTIVVDALKQSQSNDNDSNNNNRTIPNDPNDPANQNTQNEQGQSSSTPQDKNSLSDPGVQTVVSKSFSPAFIEDTTNKVIDGMTPWLSGQTDKPTFEIDLTQIRDNFADNLGDYARSRYDALPACAAGQEPDLSQDDVLTINCKPAGYDAGADIQKTVDDLKTNSDFLPQTKITADTLTVGQGTEKQPLFQKLHEAPKYYRLFKLTPILFGVLSLLSALVVIFASSTRRRGITRVATSLYLIGVILMLEAWGTIAGFNAATDSINKDSHLSTQPVVSKDAVAVLKQVQESLNHVALLMGGIILAIAVLMTVYLIATRSKQPITDVKQPKDDIPPAPEPESVSSVPEATKPASPVEEPAKPVDKKHHTPKE